MSLANSLYAALTDINVPKGQAREVVEALEQKMTTELATKSDIALVGAAIASVQTELRAETATFRAEMKTEFVEVRLELAKGLGALRTEMNDGLREVRAEMSDGLRAVRAEMGTETSALRGEMNEFKTATVAEFAAVREKMKALENRMIIKLGALIVTVFGVLPQVVSWLGW